MDPRGGPALGEVLGFSAEELAANRAGELSGRQLAVLRGSSASHGQRSGSRARTLTITGGIVVVLVAAAVLPRLTGSHGKSSGALPFVAVAVILVALLLWRSAARAGQSVSRLGGGPVSQAEGVAKTRKYGGPGGTGGQAAAGWPQQEVRSELSIGGTRFLVTEEVLAAFMNGRAYRAYYVGQGLRARIVSAELI